MSVTVEDLIKKTSLKVLIGENYLNREIKTSDISRPSLELIGYFDYYAKERIQLFGITETSFMKKMDHETLLNVANKMLTADTPAIVVSTNRTLRNEFLEVAKDKKIPILITELTSSRILASMTYHLGGMLSKRISKHGVLVDVFGLGVLITGDAGVGKSETALELIQRGHRLIADDRVEIYSQNEEALVGEAPRILRNLMELRGVGIIDVLNLFGAGAVKGKIKISLNLHLQKWHNDQEIDRLGNENDKLIIHNLEIPKFIIPVQSGRVLSVIIETVAKNFRAKHMGFDATETFNKNLEELIKKNSKK